MKKFKLPPGAAPGAPSFSRGDSIVGNSVDGEEDYNANYCPSSPINLDPLSLPENDQGSVVAAPVPFKRKREHPLPPPAIIKKKSAKPQPTVEVNRKLSLTLLNSGTDVGADSESRKFKLPPKGPGTIDGSFAVTSTRKFKAPPTDVVIPNGPKKRKRGPRGSGKRAKDEPVTFKCHDPSLMTQFSSTDFIMPEDVRKSMQVKKTLEPKLLTRRYQPATLDDFIVNKVTETNDTRAAALHEMREWARQFSEKRPGVARCLLITGSTGVGKSIAARLIMEQELKCTITEYSGDDYVDTSKNEQYAILSDKGIDEVIYKLLIRNQAFGKSGLILDGVHGASMRDDTQKKLVEAISGQKYARQFDCPLRKVWQAPIIITCDSADLSSLAKLARVCQVIELPAPNVQQLNDFCQDICRKQELNISGDLQTQIIRGCGGDIRRLINSLEFISVNTQTSEIGNGEELSKLSNVIDIRTAFYNHHTMFQIVAEFLDAQKHHSLSSPMLNSLMELHPVSLSMLLQENSLRIYDQTYQGIDVSLNSMAKTADFLSEINIIEQAVYGPQHQWELEEAFTALSTWGLVKTFPDTFVQKGINRINEFEKSAYFGWHQKEKYRRKLLSAFPQVARGQELIDVSEVISAMVTRHVSLSAKKSKEITRHDKVLSEASQLLTYCKEHNLSYKDVQDIWKCGHQEETSKMPNPRGNMSLRKLIVN